jgi:hypothetical protein
MSKKFYAKVGFKHKHDKFKELTIMISTLKNERGSGAIEALFIVIILVAIGGTGWYVYKHHPASKTVATISSNGSNPANQAAVSAPLPAGSTNTALQSDLSNITNTSAQGNSDVTSSSSSLNDQSTMTSVPQ